jgi:small Trp-rich protein
MPLAAIGAILLLLKILEVDPVAGWAWGWVLAPFGLAAAWWVFADATGYTQRSAIRRMEERKVARRERDMEALGLNVSKGQKKRARRELAQHEREQAQDRKP